MTIEVSVVVPTFNRPELLDRCLAALVVQSLAPASYEIVIADDAASETTRRQVDEWRSRCSESGQRSIIFRSATRAVPQVLAMLGGDTREDR